LLSWQKTRRRNLELGLVWYRYRYVAGISGADGGDQSEDLGAEEITMIQIRAKATPGE